MAQSTSPLQRQGTHRTRTRAHQEHESGVQVHASRGMHITHAATRPGCSSSGMPRAACAHQGSRDQDAADDVHDGRARPYVSYEHGRRVGGRRQRHHRQPAPAAPLYLRPDTWLVCSTPMTHATCRRRAGPCVRQLPHGQCYITSSASTLASTCTDRSRVRQRLGTAVRPLGWRAVT